MHPRTMTRTQIRHVFPVATLKGDEIRTPAGQRLGCVEDFVVDLESTRLVYAVICLDDSSGGSDRLLPMPAEMLSPHEEEDAFTLDVDKKKLESAPSFERGRWPDFTDRKLGTEIYRYYGRNPYWS